MNKYYVIEISTGADSIKGKGIYEYATEREAIGAFHQKLATAYKSDLFTSDLVMVIDSYGSQIKREFYQAPVVNTEETEEI